MLHQAISHPHANILLRIIRALILFLAFLYAANRLFQMTSSYGVNSSAAIATIETLNADAYDMGVLIAGKFGLSDLVRRERPMRYVLICAPGKTRPSEEPAWVIQAQTTIINELNWHDGKAFDMLYDAVTDGRPHIRYDIYFARYYPYKVFSTAYAEHQVCSNEPGNETHELARVPASVIYGDPQPRN